MTRSAWIGPAAAAAVLLAVVLLQPWRRAPVEAPTPARVPVVDAPSPVSSPAPAPDMPTPLPSPEPSATPSPEAAATPDVAGLDPAVLSRVSYMIDAVPRKKALMDALRAETRDPVWAPASEAMLSEAFTAIPGIGGDGRLLSIQCGSETCAVIGDIPTNDRAAMSTAMAGLQSYDTRKAMAARGYERKGSTFGPSASDGRQMFVTLYRRAAPRSFR